MVFQGCKAACLKIAHSVNIPPFIIADFTAGLVLGVVMLGQAIGHSQIVDVPPNVPILTCILTPWVYLLFGSSKHLSLGTGTISSLVVATAVGPQPSPDQIASITFLISIFLVLIGIFQFGWILTFLSQPALKGSLFGACILVTISQMKRLLGVSFTSLSPYPIAKLYYLALEVPKTKPITCISSFFYLLILFYVKRKKKKTTNFTMKRVYDLSTAMLFICASGFSYIISMSDLEDLAVMGSDISSSFPTPSVPSFSPEYFLDSAIVALLILTTSSAGWTEAAERRKYEVSNNRESIAIGLAACAGSFFETLPCTGSISRTILNVDMGETKLSGFVATLVCLLLYLKMEVLYYLPKNCVSCVIIAASSSLLDVDTPRWLYTLTTDWSENDLPIWIVAFIATLLGGVHIGLVCSCIFNIFIVLYRISRPQINELAKLSGSDLYFTKSTLKQGGRMEETPQVLAIRIEAPFLYVNSKFVSQSIWKLYERREDEIKHVVLDMQRVARIDSTALQMLSKISSRFKERGVTLRFTQCRGRLYQLFFRYGLDVDENPFLNQPKRFYFDRHAAIEYKEEEEEDAENDALLDFASQIELRAMGTRINVSV